MASTPKKVITEENECFICKNATNSERRIKVFGRSSINLAELIKRAVNVNLAEFEKTNAMFVCSKCYKQLIRLDGLIKSTENLCDELQRIFQQRGPVRFKRLASESPQTPRLRPKSLIMEILLKLHSRSQTYVSWPPLQIPAQTFHTLLYLLLHLIYHNKIASLW